MLKLTRVAARQQVPASCAIDCFVVVLTVEGGEGRCLERRLSIDRGGSIASNVWARGIEQVCLTSLGRSSLPVLSSIN